MRDIRSRAGRPLLAVFTALTLGACADEPSAPDTRPVPTLPDARKIVGAGDSTVIVTNTSGGTEPGSLRWATTQLPPAGGTVRFHPSLAGATITLNGWVSVPYATVIEGPADEGITISGAATRTGLIGAQMALGLRNVTITKGSPSPDASITTWGGPLYLEHTTVSEQRVLYSAIFTRGHFYLVNSTISGIDASIAVDLGVNSIAFITNSTITNIDGVVFGSRGTSLDATLFVRNSILSSNFSRVCGAYDRPAKVTFDGMSIVSDATCGTSSHAFIANPMLLPLADNGGPSLTHAFDYQSPALNGGSNCSVPVDQRWVPRDATCDIGAFEFTDFTTVTIAVDPNAVVDPATGAALVTGTITCTRTEPELGLRVRVAQSQKTGRTTTVVTGDGGTGVGGCNTTPRAWSAPVTPSSGAFQPGSALVTASTNDTPVWVRPASVSPTVKLTKPR